MTADFERTGETFGTYHGESAFVDFSIYRDTGSIGVSIDHVVLPTGTIIPRIQGCCLAGLGKQLRNGAGQ